MADELNSGFSITINFSAGEILTPAKLSAITAQLKAVAENLEAAVGDIHGSSWPYTSASTTTLSPAWARERDSDAALDDQVERKLDIVNLGRIIGPSSNLNPMALSGETSITEIVPVGVNEFSLNYPVSGDVANITTTDTSLSVFKDTPEEIVSASQWSVTQDGKVFSYTPTAGGTITYLTNPAEWAGGPNPVIAEFNVLPDINQLSVGSGVSLSGLDGNGRRTASLPTITYQQSNFAGDSSALDDADINYGQSLRLPAVLVDNLTVGDEIPSGFLYLKNYTTGEMYTNGIYYYNDENSILVENVDLTSAISANHKFCIVTVGVDITTSISDLQMKSRHTHDRTFGESFVDVVGISGILRYQNDSSKLPYAPSNMPGNWFPQYLHRDGCKTDYDNNVNQNNSLRGHLVLSPLTHILGGTTETYALCFGDVYGNASVPSIRRVNSGLAIYSHADISSTADDDYSVTALGDMSFQSSNEVSLLALAGDLNLSTIGGNIVTAGHTHFDKNNGFRSTMTLNGQGLNVWAYNGAISTSLDLNVAKAVNDDASVGSAMADIEDYHWADVSVWLSEDGETWIPTRDSTTQHYVYSFVKPTGNRTTLNLTRTSSSLLGATPFIRIVVWYLPDVS